MLEVIHRGFQDAQNELEAHLGIPICMANCGQCCTHNTVLAWGIEVEYISTWLLGNRPLLKEVIDRCDDWLRNNNGPVKSAKWYLKNPERITDDARAIYNARCPFITDDLRCLIHQHRPIVCRAFGVTTYPNSCSRPTGIGESLNMRAYNSGMGVSIRQSMEELLASALKEDRELAVVGFLPTLIMSRLAAGRFTGLVDSGKVSPVKLVRNYGSSMALIFEDQIPNISMVGDKALLLIEAKGIPTDPLTIIKVGAR